MMATRLPMSEAAFQAAVVEFAGLNSWVYWHDAPNAPRTTKTGRRFVQHVVPGFPDLLLLRPPELIVAELKRDGQYARPEQRRWLAMFSDCGIETHIWKPAMWPEIEARLSRRYEDMAA